jgi:hypothetical protein
MNLYEQIDAIEKTGKRDHTWCRYERLVASMVEESDDRVWEMSKRWKYDRILSGGGISSELRHERFIEAASLLREKSVFIQPVNELLTQVIIN